MSSAGARLLMVGTCAFQEGWEASVARRLPCRWNLILLPGSAQPRYVG